jgi:hypothetical protein
MIKEVIEGILGVFLKIWDGLYIRGIKDYSKLITMFKSRDVVPRLDDVLKMSEAVKLWHKKRNNNELETKTYIESNLTEQEKINLITANFEYIRQNKLPEDNFQLYIEILNDTKSNLTRFVEPIILCSSLKRILSIHNHSILSMEQLKGVTENLESTLIKWNDRCLKIPTLEKVPFRRLYSEFENYRNTVVKTISDVNEIIHILKVLRIKHILFLAAILIIGGAVYFNEMTALVVKYLYAQITT